jgi:hypothetical protein
LPSGKTPPGWNTWANAPTNYPKNPYKSPPAPWETPVPKFNNPGNKVSPTPKNWNIPNPNNSKAFVQRTPTDRLSDKDFNFYNFSNPYRASNPSPSVKSPIPSPTNTSNPFNSPRPPQVNNINPYNPYSLPTINPNSGGNGGNLVDFGQRLLDLLDNNFPRELEPPRSPEQNLQQGVYYRVFWTAINWFDQAINDSFTVLGSFNVTRKLGYGYPSGRGLFAVYTGNSGQQIEEQISYLQTGGLFELDFFSNQSDALKVGTFQITSIIKISDGVPASPSPAIYSPTNTNPTNPNTLQFTPSNTNPSDTLDKLLDGIPNTPSAKPIIKKNLGNKSGDELTRLADTDRVGMDSLRDQLTELIRNTDLNNQRTNELREQLRDIQDQLRQNAENEALQDAERALIRDIERYDNIQRELLREAVRDTTREQTTNTEPRSLFGEQLRRSVDNFENNTPSNTGTNPTRNPFNNITGSNGGSINPSNNTAINPTVTINPVTDRIPSSLPPSDTNTGTTTRQEIQTTIERRTDTTPRTNTPTNAPAGCRNTDDPIGRCLGDIEAKLNDISSNQAPPNQQPQAIQGIIQNIKCSKFSEIDDSPASFDYQGNNFLGISSQIQALSRLVSEVKKDICRMETIAAIPDYWPPRRNREIPQLVIHFAEKLSGGKPGKTRYSVVIPHYKGSRRPEIGSYLKGRYAACLILKDESKLIINAKTESGAKSTIRALSRFIDSRFLPSDVDVDPSKRRDKPKEVRVYPISARFFPKGQQSGDVEWVHYFPF